MNDSIVTSSNLLISRIGPRRTSKVQKVLIALIHNEEQSRLEYLNNELELIKLMLIRWGYFPRIIKVGGGGGF